ncbi:alpha/beta fold hydrolase, partial [bacterium]|nr:alpha/beta fold hydrolase [bacterium]
YIERKNNIPMEKRSFLLLQEHKAPACILIHGAGGSPAEMRGLGDYLYNLGFTVYAIRLPLQINKGNKGLKDYMRGLFHGIRDYDGTKRRATNRNTWSACLSESEIVLDTLLDYSADTAVIGFSFGGLIALNLMKKFDINRTVLLSPALFLRDRGNLFFQYILKGTPGLAKRIDPTKYTIAEFIQRTRSQTKTIKQAFLVVQSIDDPVLSLKGYAFLKRHSNNRKSEFVLLEKGGHIIVKEEKAEEVFKLTGRFIRKA